jgi:integrase
MENNLIVLTDFEPLIELTIKSLTNEHTRRSYRRSIEDFLKWWDLEGKPPFSKDVVLKYRLEMTRGQWKPATINLHINVIHKLATEALDAGLINADAANGILRVKGVKNNGARAGNWLTIEQAEQLINSPDSNNPIGIRDRAILAIFLGSGLRRSEIANLTVEHIQKREDRWCVCDICGKGNRTRTVPIPNWVYEALEAWMFTGKVFSGFLFYPMDRTHAHKPRVQLNSQSLYNLVVFYAKLCGLNVSPHDCRRTFGKLSYKGGSDIVQIQASLGHSSPTTTLKYLGDVQNFEDAPADHLGLNL